MSANTPNPSSHTHDAGVPPAPPEAHPKADFLHRNNRLRRTAAHWLGCDTGAVIRVLHRWTRPDDDARAVRLETAAQGQIRRITLYRQSTGAWSPLYH